MCIGNTGDQQRVILPNTVYPYVYREHVRSDFRETQKCRFIPMCIGNTFALMRLPLLFSVYPYVYREHVLTNPKIGSPIGLSLCV